MLIQSLLTPAFIALLAAVAQYTAQNQATHLDSTFIAPPRDVRLSPSPALTRMSSLGQVAAAVDWFWLRAILDPAYAWVQRGTHAPTYYDLKIASQLDPAFFDLFAYGAVVLSVARNDNEGAEEVLKIGEQFRLTGLNGLPAPARAKYWSDAWVVTVSLATTQLLELQKFDEAAENFTRASQIEGAPGYLQGLRRKLDTELGRATVGKRAVALLLKRPLDEDVRARLEIRLRELEEREKLLDPELSSSST